MDRGGVKLSIASIKTEGKISYIANNLRMEMGEVLQLLTQIMEKTIQYTVPEIEQWIKKYVPKRTGQLQNSLLDSVNKTEWTGQQLRLILFTDVEYARELNNRKDIQIQHNNEIGSAYYYGHYGKLILNDSNAYYDFMGLLKMFARQHLKDNFKRARFEICGSVGVSAAPISKTIKVRNE